MDSEELSESLAYYSLDPYHERRADWRSAVIASVLANQHRPENAEPYPIDMFMPKYGGDEVSEGETKEQIAERINASLQRFAAFQNIKNKPKEPAPK